MTNGNNVSYKETFNDAANNITKVLINCVHNNCFNCGGTMGEGEGEGVDERSEANRTVYYVRPSLKRSDTVSGKNICRKGIIEN